MAAAREWEDLPVPAPSRARILVVDETTPQGDAIASRLRLEGFAATVATSAVHALELVGRQDFDLTVASVSPAGMSGYALSRALKLSSAPRPMPVLLLLPAPHPRKTMRDPRKTVQGLGSGADCFVARSTEDRLLVARIRWLLAKRNGDADRNEESFE